MHQREIERFAFLYLSNTRDKKLLLGKINMTYLDFERLIYITEFLGFHLLNRELWNSYFKRFETRWKVVEQIHEEVPMEFTDWEGVANTQEEWLHDFCKQIADKKACKKLLVYLAEQYQEREMILPEWVDIP